MNNIIYRKLCVEDAREFHKLKNFVWRDTYKKFMDESVFIERENRVKDASFDMVKFLQINDENTLAYVAEVDGRIVGILVGNARNNAGLDIFPEDEFGLLGVLYIHPDFQRKGIGTHFKDIFEKWLMSKGVNKYIIDVLEKNEKGRSAYEAWGGKLEDVSFEKVFGKKLYKICFYSFKI